MRVGGRDGGRERGRSGRNNSQQSPFNIDIQTFFVFMATFMMTHVCTLYWSMHLVESYTRYCKKKGLSVRDNRQL